MAFYFIYIVNWIISKYFGGISLNFAFVNAYFLFNFSLLCNINIEYTINLNTTESESNAESHL